MTSISHSATQTMPHTLHPSSLREYDIRGPVGPRLGPDDARAVGRSFATRVRRAGGSRVAVGRDGRLSSPELEAALVDGLTASGVDVVRIGLGPTPIHIYTFRNDVKKNNRYGDPQASLYIDTILIYMPVPCDERMRSSVSAARSNTG